MNTVLRALWGKVNGVGITNPSEVTTLLRDLNKRLNSLEERYEELANGRPEADRDAGESIPSVDSSNAGRRQGSKTGSKSSPPSRGK